MSGRKKGEKAKAGMKKKSKRRSIRDITEYINPKGIFKLITGDPWEYTSNKEKYRIRDTAMMAMTYVSIGRIAAVVGGHRFRWDKNWGEITGQRFDKKTGESIDIHKGKAFNLGKENKHQGIQRENLEVTNKFIKVRGMKVVKRSQKIIDKHGLAVTIRDNFAIPLQEDLFKNKFWNQLIPFGWLILEYLAVCAPNEGKLFRFEATRAWQIIKVVTGQHPHWFRAQAENFYGHFIITDSIKLAKFLKIRDPKSVVDYIGYDWTEQLKDANILMDFDWIQKEVAEIKERTRQRIRRK